jgi:hypothetical protein
VWIKVNNKQPAPTNQPVNVLLLNAITVVNDEKHNIADVALATTGSPNRQDQYNGTN